MGPGWARMGLKMTTTQCGNSAARGLYCFVRPMGVGFVQALQAMPQILEYYCGVPRWLPVLILFVELVSTA